MEKLVVIGAGAAGLSAVENAAKAGKEVEIIMITEENYLPYSRIKLSKYMYNEFNVEELYLKNQQWYDEKGIKLMLGKKVVEINPDKSFVLLDNGEEINYTTLVLANGSSSFIPPIPGVNKRGVFSVRSMEDILNIQRYIRNNRVQNIAVIGGGLLGIEAAWSFREVNDDFNISIIEAVPRLLPRQLDEEGSNILGESVIRNGIQLFTGVSVKEISGEESAEGIVLSDGNLVKAELIIISAGVRSNISLPSGAGIKINRGVVVDKNMRSSIENIFAAGDVAEYNGNVWGLWPVAVEQGKIAGLNALGISSEYNEITPSSLLQVMDVKVFSTGDFADPELKSVKYEGEGYSKLFFKDGVIKGGILIGDTRKGFSVKKAIEQKRDFTQELNEDANILHII